MQQGAGPCFTQMRLFHLREMAAQVYITETSAAWARVRKAVAGFHRRRLGLQQDPKPSEAVNIGSIDVCMYTHCM